MRQPGYGFVILPHRTRNGCGDWNWKSNSGLKAFKIWKNWYRAFTFYLAWLFHPWVLGQILAALTYFNSYFYLVLACATLHHRLTNWSAIPFSSWKLGSSRLSTHLLNEAGNSMVWHKGRGIHTEHLPILSFFYLCRGAVFFPTILGGLTHQVSQCGALLQPSQLKVQMRFMHSNPHNSSLTWESVIHAPLLFILRKITTLTQRYTNLIRTKPNYCNRTTRTELESKADKQPDNRLMSKIPVVY